MANPKRALQRLQHQARKEFQRTEMGRLVRDVERLSRARSSSATDRVAKTTRRIARLAQRHGTSLGSEMDALVAGVTRYAREGLRGRMVQAVLSQFGEVGGLVGQLLNLVGQAGSRPSRADQMAADLRAALAMVGAFRPELLSDQGRREAGIDPEEVGFTPRAPRVHTAPSRAPEPAESQSGQWVTVNLGGRRRTYSHDDPTVTGEMIDVESTNVHSIGFLWNQDNPTKGTLQVRFLQTRKGTKSKGPGPLYYYYGVHPDVFQAFRRAASKGVFVWDRIRVRGSVAAHRYQYELKGIVNGYVPRQATRFGSNEYFVRRSVRARSGRTGEIGEFESQLPDRLANRPSRGAPDVGVPRRGVPQRGTPNRGR